MNPNTDTLTLLRDAVSRRKKRRDETPREYASTIAKAEPSGTRSVFLCTQPLTGSRGASVRWATLDENNYVDGETPVEDFGMWFVTDHTITDKAAERILSALLGRREGEEPEVGTMSAEDRLMRRWSLPTLLEPEEFEIYTKLVAENP